MGPIGSFVTSVTNYHTTLRKIPEGSRSNLNRDVSLKSSKPPPLEGAGLYISDELATLHKDIAIRFVNFIQPPLVFSWSLLLK
jgi:hypothetical protein